MALSCAATGRSCAFALVGLLLVCCFSRMSMSESALAAYGRDQMVRTVWRVCADADAQGEMSRQDADPLIALLHNVEAGANLRAAKRLAEESGTLKESKRDFVSILAELGQEQDTLIRALLPRLR